MVSGPLCYLGATSRGCPAALLLCPKAGRASPANQGGGPVAGSRRCFLLSRAAGSIAGGWLALGPWLPSPHRGCSPCTDPTSLPTSFQGQLSGNSNGVCQQMAKKTWSACHRAHTTPVLRVPSSGKTEEAGRWGEEPWRDCLG